MEEEESSSVSMEKDGSSLPSVIVIGAGISGIAAARVLHDASFKVVVLESRNRIGGRVYTDYSFGFPVDMGASWLHGVCNENPLAPLIRTLGLPLYRTSGDNSVLYDHDLESCALFDTDGSQVPQQLVLEVGEIFVKILKETEKVRDEHRKDMSVHQALSIVLDRYPHLRPEGLALKVLQWYLCRMEGWFAADTDAISLKNWDQEQMLTGGHGLMVQGYHPLINGLAKGLDILLEHRVVSVTHSYNGVTVTIEGGRSFSANAAIVTVPLGVLKAKLIEFEPKLPEWKESAISDLGVGSENKIALHFDSVFWPNVEVLGVVGPTPSGCTYFLNLHKATGHPVLVYMPSGRLAHDIEKMSDQAAANFAMTQLKRILPDAIEPVQYLVSRWGSDRDSLGCYCCDLVNKPDDIYERLQLPVGSLFFAGEAVSTTHSGTVHGAFASGVLTSQNCHNHLLKLSGHLYGDLSLFQPVMGGDISVASAPLTISRM
ncbi:hypothetical protein AMTRI_Chr09g33070 [Amborella trichopoda]